MVPVDRRDAQVLALVLGGALAILGGGALLGLTLRLFLWAAGLG